MYKQKFWNMQFMEEATRIKVFYFLYFLPLSVLFVLKRHVIGLWPHVPLNIALQSPWHTQTHCRFCRGSQEGCRVHGNRVALSYLIVLRNHTHACCAMETWTFPPPKALGLETLRDLQLICMHLFSCLMVIRWEVLCIVYKERKFPVFSVLPFLFKSFETQVKLWVLIWQFCQQSNVSYRLLCEPRAFLRPVSG